MGVGWLSPQVGRNQQGAGTAEPVPLNGQSYNVFHGKLVINPTSRVQITRGHNPKTFRTLHYTEISYFA